MTRRALLALVVWVPGAGCGSASVEATAPVAPAAGPPTIVIGSAGASPQFLHLFGERKLLVVNRDSRAHAMFSNPHPQHTECAGTLNVGTLQPGESRDLDLDPGPGPCPCLCNFHDEGDPLNAAFAGWVFLH